jgi:hypothetical protein
LFKTQHVETYLQDTFPIIEGDKRMAVLRCYVNPISFELASEVSTEVAAALFSKVGKEMMPRSITNKMAFTVNPDPHSLSFCRDPQYAGTRVFVESVKISKLEAGKVTPESNDWAFMFTVSFEPKDRSVTKDLFELLHEKFFLTFEKLQPGLFDNEGGPVMNLECLLCQVEDPEFCSRDEKRAYCRNCHHNAADDDQPLKRIRPDVARASAIADDMRGDEGEGDEGPKQRDPLADEGDFINSRNSGRKKRRAKR